MIERLPRRGFLTGIAAVICAPSIVRAASLMPVKAYSQVLPPTGLTQEIIQQFLHEAYKHGGMPNHIWVRRDHPLLGTHYLPVVREPFQVNPLQSSFQQPMRLG